MTALSGLPAYLDLAAVARLRESVRRHVGVREGTQGWTDAQMVMSLVMLNLSGGESVDDLRLLERDEGLGRVLLAGESHRMRRSDRRAQRNRWRRERRRVVPSPTAVFRYLDLPRRVRGGQEAAWQSVHTGVQRRAVWAWEGSDLEVRRRPYGTRQGDFGHGATLIEQQEGGAVLLQEVPSTSR